MKRFALLFLLGLFGIFTSDAQEDCPMEIGINLAGPVDYGSEYPFVNVFKYARNWITHNHPDWTGGVPWEPWDTQLSDQIPLDDHGYPLEVPFTVPGADTAQVVRTVWANAIELATGTYTLLYDGIGEIEFWGNARTISSEPGRMEVEIIGGPDNNGDIIGMEIMESRAGDHIRNIRFLLPGTEDTYRENIFSEAWLEKLAPFKTIRFMDWGHTNNSVLQHWEDRPQINDFSYTMDGVPYEYFIELCNLQEADPWICIPHLADENYVRQMARMFRDGLTADQTIYVEYSNEVWNWLFDQTHYGHDSLDQSLAWPERVAPRIAEVMQWWTEEFAGQEDRLVRVLGLQNGYFDIGDRIFRQLRTDGHGDLIDALSPSGYISYDSEEIAALGADATGADIIASSRRLSFDENQWLMENWRQNAVLADEYDKQLLFYEAGEHFTPQPWGTVQDYTPALQESHSHPLLYDLYMELFDTLAELSDSRELMMHFSFITPAPENDPNNGRYGNFGALQSQFYQFPPYDESPKYRAILDYPCELNTNTTEPLRNFKLYPNPNNGAFSILTEGISDNMDIVITDLLGRTQAFDLSEKGENYLIQLRDPSAGIYFVQMTQNDGRKWTKSVIVTL